VIVMLCPAVPLCGMPNCLSTDLYGQNNTLVPAPSNWAVLQNKTYLISTSGAYALVFQSNGDLVVSSKQEGVGLLEPAVCRHHRLVEDVSTHGT
jgi:hypothetical protein